MMKIEKIKEVSLFPNKAKGPYEEIKLGLRIGGHSFMGMDFFVGSEDSMSEIRAEFDKVESCLDEIVRKCSEGEEQ